jgi:hypothetical protein
MFMDRSAHLELASAITARDADAAARLAWKSLSQLVDLSRLEFGDGGFTHGTGKESDTCDPDGIGLTRHEILDQNRHHPTVMGFATKSGKTLSPRLPENHRTSSSTLRRFAMEKRKVLALMAELAVDTKNWYPHACG